MSKKSATGNPLLSMDAAAWRQRVQQLTIPMRKYWPEDAAEIMEANAGFLIEDILASPEKYQLKTLRPAKSKGYAIDAEDLSAILRHLFHAGFLEAVLMHRRELMAAGDWIEWKQKQGGGGDKGRKGSSIRAADLKKRIREKWAAMEAAGEKVTNKTVADAMKSDGWKCSETTVRRAFQPETNKRTKR